MTDSPMVDLLAFIDAEVERYRNQEPAPLGPLLVPAWMYRHYLPECTQAAEAYGFDGVLAMNAHAWETRR